MQVEKDHLGWWYLLLLIVYALLLRIPALFHQIPVHSDSTGFMAVLALFRGDWQESVAPYRIEFPVYPYLLYIANRFVPDWIQAGKLAALIPSLLAPLFVSLATNVLVRNRSAAFFSGFLAASSPVLIQIAAEPLYDSSFICALALFLLGGFLFLKNPAFRTAILLGAVTGLTFATRGLGLFLVPPLVCAIFVLPDTSLFRKFRFSVVILLVAFVVAGAIRLPARIAARALLPNQDACLKEVMFDGNLYARGDRDAISYRLNDSASAFQMDNVKPCELTWMQYVSIYYKNQLRTFARNLKLILFSEFSEIFSPFLALFIPMALGSLYLLQQAYRPQLVLIGTTFLSFLLFVSAIQYQDRYLFPLAILVSVLCGVGCVQLMQEGKYGRFILVPALLFSLVVAADACRQTTKGEAEGNYRAACAWIVSQNGASFPFGVMAKHQGVYDYLRHGLVLLPVDEPGRVQIFADYMHVKYVLEGPEERHHNPVLFSSASFLTPVAKFGAGPESVEVLRFDRQPLVGSPKE
jgi:4-amino-4-deoxy-L-arabinose transferase-like glycosyltransferase